MPKLAVVTMVTGEAFQSLAEVTMPSIRDYAQRLRAEFVVLDQRVFPHPQYDKWQIGQLLEQYDRLVYIDADAIVRPDCPNLFVMVPDERVGGENELKTFPAQAKHLQTFAARMGFEKMACPYYVNTGVLVVSRCHRELFRKPERIFGDLPWPEQTHFNFRLLRENVPVCFMPQAYNDRHRRDEYLRRSFILHYSVMPNEARIAAAKRDLAAWDRLFGRGEPAERAKNQAIPSDEVLK